MARFMLVAVGVRKTVGMCKVSKSGLGTGGVRCNEKKFRNRHKILDLLVITCSDNARNKVCVSNNLLLHPSGRFTDCACALVYIGYGVVSNAFV